MIFKNKPIITQYFGENREYYKKFGNNGHEGIDLIPPDDHYAIYAFIGGTVRRAYESMTYGLTAIIHSPALRLSFRYAHMQILNVKEGEVIPAGTIIGMMGNTPDNAVGIDGRRMRAPLHLNCIPMTVFGMPDYPDNGYKGRVDPLGILRFMGEL